MPRKRIDTLRPVVRAVCEAVGSPRALSVWLCFESSPRDLISLSTPNPADPDTSAFALDYFVTEFLSKFKGLKTDVDLRDVALQKWKLSETRCADTNQRFRESRFRAFSAREERVLFNARRKIASVLGKFSAASALRDCKWGPGSTLDIPRVEAEPDIKMTPPISVTPACLPYLRAVMQSDPHWVGSFLGSNPEGPFSLTREFFCLVRGSRFLTVPKSAKTDRCIAAEPTGNSFLQQGVHSYIRRRLRRFGVRLDDQSINQRGAQDAYVAGLSTLDLSAASDSISTELVYNLLPLDWAMFLDCLRSPETLVDGQWMRTEKFASMGNAFCFELETLIFWALAGSVDGFQEGVDRLIVYGDDVIVSRRHFAQVVDTFEHCGFEINQRKSFADGYFFESCGKHYHRSVEVTPAYQKERVTSPSELIRLHNRLVRLVERLTDQGITLDLSKALRMIRDSYPLRPFPRIPQGCADDGGFLVPRGELPLDLARGYRCTVLDYTPNFASPASEAALLAYKLRRPKESNARNSGHAAHTSTGKWRTRVRYIPLSSLTARW